MSLVHIRGRKPKFAGSQDGHGRLIQVNERRCDASAVAYIVPLPVSAEGVKLIQNAVAAPFLGKVVRAKLLHGRGSANPS